MQQGRRTLCDMKRLPRLGRPRLAVIAALALLLLAVPETFAVPLGPYSGDLAASGTSLIGRPVFAATTTCNKPISGASKTGTASRKYISYAFVNDTGADQCVTVDYKSTNGKNLTIAMYFGAFNPTNVTQNLAGGPVTSSCGGTSGSFTTYVPSGTTFIVVVAECQIGAGGQFQFTLTEQCACVTFGDYIRQGSGPWVANGVLKVSRLAGETATFTISIRNGGPLDFNIKVGAEGADLAGFQLTYLHGTKDVTAAINAGTYTKVVHPGGDFRIKAKVKVTSSAPIGPTFSNHVDIQHYANGAMGVGDVWFGVVRSK
jgi:hypothetical protein